MQTRDMLRKAAFGVNFAIIGIENQETIDYSMPLRNMSYDVGEYEKQAVRIRKSVRKNASGLTAGEYLYGFRKDSRLHPVVTFVLYTGAEEWDGPRFLHEMLDFTGIPEELRNMAADYRIHLVEIRKLRDTSVFRTDLRQVFDFIRCAEDKAALKELVGQDDYYKNMEEDAFDVVSHYTNTAGLIGMKKYYRKDGKVNMCKALEDWIEEERAEGKAEGLEEGRIKGIEEGKAEGIAEGKIEGVILMCREFNLSDDVTVKKLQKMFFLSEREAKKYLKNHGR